MCCSVVCVFFVYTKHTVPIDVPTTMFIMSKLSKTLKKIIHLTSCKIHWCSVLWQLWKTSKYFWSVRYNISIYPACVSFHHCLGNSQAYVIVSREVREIMEHGCRQSMVFQNWVDVKTYDVSFIRLRYPAVSIQCKRGFYHFLKIFQSHCYKYVTLIVC